MDRYGYFTDAEKEILVGVATELDEFFVEERKNVPQNKMVIGVEEGTYYNYPEYKEIPIPSHLVGTWMMDYADDLSHKPKRECINQYKWVRCEQVKVVVTQWEEIK